MRVVGVVAACKAAALTAYTSKVAIFPPAKNRRSAEMQSPAFFRACSAACSAREHIGYGPDHIPR